MMTMSGTTEMTDLARSIIRALVPIGVGLGTSLLAHVGIKSPDLVAAIGAVVASAYAAGIRWLERRYPRVGRFLGVKGAPTYPR